MVVVVLVVGVPAIERWVALSAMIVAVVVVAVAVVVVVMVVAVAVVVVCGSGHRSVVRT